jgi:hypothetical protein
MGAPAELDPARADTPDAAALLTRTLADDEAILARRTARGVREQAEPTLAILHYRSPSRSGPGASS